MIRVIQGLSGYAHNVALRDELLDLAWPDGGGTDESLTRAISLLRKAFKTLGAENPVIKTVHKRGYCLALPVTFPASHFPATQRASTTEVPRDIVPSIAVLAFSDMSPEPNYQHIGDGISEEILSALTKNETFRVAARTSAFSFKGKDIDLSIIGKALNVKYVLEGTIRVAGERLKVSANLIDTETGFRVSSESFDGAMKDIFVAQEAIAQAIYGTLSQELFDRKQRLTEVLTDNPLAYELFLQGRALNQRIYGEGTLEAAKDFLNKAIALDPKFSQAYEELAHTHSLESTYYVTDREKRPKIKTAAQYARQAIALNPSLGFAMTFIAIEKMTQGDLVGAIDLTEKAYQLDHNNAEVNLRLGYFYLMIGRVKHAIPYLEKSVALDPIQGRNLQVLAIAKLANDDLIEAERLAKRSLDLQYIFAFDVHSAATFAQGDWDLAVKRHSKPSGQLRRTFGMEDIALWEMAAKGLYSGDPIMAKNFAQMVIAMLGTEAMLRGEEPAPIPLVMTLLRTGSAEELFNYIGDTPPPGSNAVMLNFWAAGDPCAKIYGHPDFMSFAERIGLADAWRKFGWPDRLLQEN